MPQSHKQLFALLIGIVAFLFVVGVFALGYTVGVHTSKKIFLQERKMGRGEMFSSGSELPPLHDPLLPRGIFPKPEKQQFGVSGIITNREGKMLQITDGKGVQRGVLLLPDTKIRGGGRQSTEQELTSGREVTVLGRPAPMDPDILEAKMITIR